VTARNDDAIRRRRAAILEGIATGATSDQLATRLHLSRQGVDYHIAWLMTAFKAANRAAAVARAYASGVLCTGVWPPKVAPKYLPGGEDDLEDGPPALGGAPALEDLGLLPVRIRVIDIAAATREMYGEAANHVAGRVLPEHEYRFQIIWPSGTRESCPDGWTLTADMIAAGMTESLTPPAHPPTQPDQGDNPS
jgi:DNA-binding CsgD family transcriptional regulator